LATGFLAQTLARSVREQNALHELRAGAITLWKLSDEFRLIAAEVLQTTLLRLARRRVQRLQRALEERVPLGCWERAKHA